MRTLAQGYMQKGMLLGMQQVAMFSASIGV